MAHNCPEARSTMPTYRPETSEALAAVVHKATSLRVPLLEEAEGLRFDALVGGIRHDVADGVVSCLAGTTLTELNAELARDGRWIPHLTVWPTGVDDLASLVLLGLPHAGEAAWGTWRDWILGATMITAEGRIVKSGARVVKSVAGYDAHKLLVGSRGTLLLPAEITLRTFPILRVGFPQGVHISGENPRSIHRVLPTDLPACRASLAADVLAIDEATGTLWTSRSVQDLPHFNGAWSMDLAMPSIPEALLPLHRRAKAVLDPGGKLAPGAFHNLGISPPQ